MTKLAIIAAAIFVIWTAANLTPIETRRALDRVADGKGQNIGEIAGSWLAPSRKTMEGLEKDYTRQHNERLSK